MGAIVALVIGVWLFLVPRPGSVECHKKEYAAWNQGKMGWLERRVPCYVQRVLLAQREKQLKFHGEALQKAGYGNELPELCGLPVLRD